MAPPDPTNLTSRPRLEDLHRSQGTMIAVRWVGIPWALLQVLSFEQEYPAGYEALALGLVGLLATGNAAIWLLHRRPDATARSFGLAIAGLALDIIVLSGFVALYAFDPDTAIWATLFIVPLEGAILFRLTGAVTTWGIVVALYTAREIWGSQRYGYELLWNSITFRMGIGGIIALVAGFMGRDVFRERTRLEDALAEIRRVDRLRSGFVSMLGHDIRTPLTVIRGVVGTLLMRYDRVSSADRTHLLSSADRQARRLEQLATDLLDLARLEENRLELEIAEVDLERLVREALSYVEGSDSISVDIEQGLRVVADPRRLEQVVINLASNALNHGAAPVWITGISHNSRAIVEVADSGTGVDDAEVDELFEAFRTRSKAGSIGFGLAIVKALVEAQGGEVSYQPSTAGGACFRIVLPALGTPSTDP